MTARRGPPWDDAGRKLPPLVVPGRRDRDGYGRPPWKRLLLVLAVLLAAAYGVMKLAGSWGETSLDEPNPAAGRPVPLRPAPPVVSAEPSPTPADRASGAAPGRRPYAALADSLSAAIDRYGQRASDFRQGIIDCASLARGYSEVDDAFVRLSLLVRSQADSVDAAWPEYRQLAARADPVYRDFDASGCSRPNGR